MRRKRRKNNQIKLITITSLSLLFLLTVGYAAFSTNINITAKGNILEKSRVIKSYTKTSNEDFHTDFYRENIVTATFLNANKVPNNAVESWDVSETKDGGVKAYVTPSTSETNKYDLFIGANNGVIANEDSSYLFFNFQNVKSINFNNNFNTSNTTNMAAMFNHCLKLSELDLSEFDTSNVINMKIMFMGCNSLTELDLSSFDTSNVVNMGAMFSGWNDADGGNSKNSLTKIIFGNNFNTSKVTNMNDLFAYNSNLETIKGLENFNTSKVTNMAAMFYSCEKITELNLCSFDTSAVTNMDGTFRNMKNINRIYVGPQWTTANANTSNLFYNSKISSVTTGQC